MTYLNTILVGDVREQLATLPDESVHCVVTSPPYWGLRDYGTASWVGGGDAAASCDHRGRDHSRNDTINGANGHFSPGTRGTQPAKEQTIPWRERCGKCGAERLDAQLGLELTPASYVEKIVAVFQEVRRVLRNDGTLWLNLGDCYANDGKRGGETGGKQAYLSDSDRRRDGREKRVTGLKPKDMVGMPWRVAFALQADGWWLRSDIIWSKNNPMPESVVDRPTKSHEYVFLLTKSQRYFYDADAIKVPASLSTHARISQKSLASQHGGPKQVDYQERSGRNRRDKSPDEMVKALAARAPGVNPKAAQNALGSKQNASFSAAVAGSVLMRNARTVWEIPTQPYAEAHFATYPEALVKPCILAGCPVGGVVLDPFMGSGTTGLVAYNAGRDFVGIELNPAYAAMAMRRIRPERGRLALE